MTPLRAFSIGGTAMRVPTGDGHNTLHNLTVKFGSLVDAPANPGAHILLFKRDDEAAELDAAVASLTKVGRKMSGARKTALKAAMEHLTRILSEVDGDDADDAEDTEEKPKMAKQTDTPATEPATAPVVEKVETAPVAEDVSKRMADLEKRATEAEARAAAAEDIAKAERDARLTADFVKKAEALPNLTIAADALGSILKRAHDVLKAEDAAELMRVLAAANEQAGAGKALTTAVGKAGNDAGESATAKLNKMALDLIEKKVATNYGDAIVKVVGDPANAGLAEAYRREQLARH